MSEAAKQRVPWWIYLLATSLVFAFCFNVWVEAMGPELSGVDTDGFTLRCDKITPGSPFDKAGVRERDVLLAVDGQKLGNLLDWLGVATSFEISKPIVLDVQRGQQTLRLTVVFERPRFRQFDLGDYVAFFSMRGAQLVCLALALLVVFSRPNDLSARLAGWLLASLAVVNTSPFRGGAAFLRHMPVPIALLALVPIALSMGGGGPTAWFCFFATFPRRTLTKPWHWLLAVLPSIVLLPHGIWQVYWVYLPDRVAGFFSFRVALLIVVVAVGQEFAGLSILVFNYFRLHDVNERRKVRILLIGTLIGWPAAIAIILVPSAVVAVAAPILFLAFPFSFAYVILRHRLFEVSVIIRQGLQYALARRVIILAVPAAIALLVVDLISKFTMAGTLIATGYALSLGQFLESLWMDGMIGAGIVLVYMKHQRWLDTLDRRFFRERYSAQLLLRQTVEELRASRSLEQAGPRIVSRIEAALHPEFCALMVREANQPTYTCEAVAPAGITLPGLVADSKLMAAFRLFAKPLQISLSESGWLKQQLPHADTEFLRQARIDLMVPVSLSATGREALLVLGQKKSEEPYGSEDEELLLAIANSLALLLERPAGAPASAGLEECPRCGGCYDSGVGKCAQDGSQLAPLALPRLLSSRYRLDRRLGRGGMGTVYSALDTSLERQVALKLIREDLVSSSEAAERFRREAKAAAAITHPNLVTLYDFAVDADNRAFLVMELLSGMTLRQQLQQGRMSCERTLEILRGVCSALVVAHQRGLVHRDLKPENIFLVRDESRDVPKVLDFGLAKFVASSEGSTQATMDTGAGVLVGTRQYMSPEQLRGEPLSAAWDLWALAIISYEMLTGAYPFGNPASVAALHNAILSGQVISIRRYLPQAPAEWEEFFVCSMSPEASRRPGSAAAYLAECERVLAQPSAHSAQ